MDPQQPQPELSLLANDPGRNKDRRVSKVNLLDTAPGCRLEALPIHLNSLLHFGAYHIQPPRRKIRTIQPWTGQGGVHDSWPVMGIPGDGWTNYVRKTEGLLEIRVLNGTDGQPLCTEHSWRSPDFGRCDAFRGVPLQHNIWWASESGPLLRYEKFDVIWHRPDDWRRNRHFRPTRHKSRGRRGPVVEGIRFVPQLPLYGRIRLVLAVGPNCLCPV